MAVHLQRQISKLKKMLLSLGAMCEEALADAIEAVNARDPELAERVIAGDRAVDEAEIEVEEECLHTLALHQPVAFDLRFVVAVLKMTHDLERIGDHAASIADHGKTLTLSPEVPVMPFDFDRMSSLTLEMLRKSLDALVNIDAERAREVRALDDEVDDINRAMYSAVADAMVQYPSLTDQYMHLSSVSRQLERIADHACNIAKDVLYMAEGEIMRHSKRM
ncbi:MAG: phosphate signaling complex protein PhoU [Planctomycetota bacterium]